MTANVFTRPRSKARDIVGTSSTARASAATRVDRIIGVPPV
jgi:hypothetical protein